MTLEEITEIATEVASEYKVSSIDDIIEMKDKLNLEKFSELVQLKSVEFKISKT
jgi:hypothetical protein